MPDQSRAISYGTQPQAWLRALAVIGTAVVFVGCSHPSQAWFSQYESTYGYVDKSGKWVFPPRYKYAGSFSEGLANVELTNGHCAFIDKNGKLVLDERYYYARPFHDGIALVNCDADGVIDSYYINKAGRIVARKVTDSYFEDGIVRSEGAQVLYKKGLWGFSDEKGNVLVEPKFAGLGMLREGLAPASKARRYGFVDVTGKWIIAPQFEGASEFHCGRARVEREVERKTKDGNWLDKQYGYIDRTGKVVIPFQFCEAYDFSEGVAAAKETKSCRWGYIDLSGKWVMPPDLFSASCFHNGRAMVTRQQPVKNGLKIWSDVIDKGGQRAALPRATKVGDNQPLRQYFEFGKRGYATDEGAVVIPARYEQARDFVDGMAAVVGRTSLGMYHWGFVDRQGRMAVPDRFSEVRDFNGGIAAAAESFPLLGRKWGFINKKGDVLLRCQYEWACNFGDGLAYVEQNTLVGSSERVIIDQTGKTVAHIPLKVRITGEFGEGLAPACIGYRAESKDPDAPVPQ